MGPTTKPSTANRNMANHPKRGKLQRLASAASASRTPSLGSISQPVNKSFRVNLPRPKLLNVTDFSALSATIQKGMAGKAQFEKREKEEDDRAAGKAYLPQYLAKVDALKASKDPADQEYAKNLVTYANNVDAGLLPATASVEFWEVLSGSRGLLMVNQFRALDGPLKDLRELASSGNRTESTDEIVAKFDELWNEHVTKQAGDNPFAAREAGSHYGVARAQFMESVGQEYNKQVTEVSKLTAVANLSTEAKRLFESTTGVTDDGLKVLADLTSNLWIGGQLGVGGQQAALTSSLMAQVDSLLSDSDTGIASGNLPKSSREGTLMEALDTLNQIRGKAVFKVGANYVPAYTGKYLSTIDSKISQLAARLEAEGERQLKEWPEDRLEISKLPASIGQTLRGMVDDGTSMGAMDALNKMTKYDHDALVTLFGEEDADILKPLLDEYPRKGFSVFVQSLEGFFNDASSIETPDFLVAVHSEWEEVKDTGSLMAMEAMLEQHGNNLTKQERDTWAGEIRDISLFDTHRDKPAFKNVQTAASAATADYERLNGALSQGDKNKIRSLVEGRDKKLREEWAGRDPETPLTNAALTPIFQPGNDASITAIHEILTETTDRHRARFDSLASEIGSGKDVDLDSLSPDSVSPKQLETLYSQKRGISHSATLWTNNFRTPILLRMKDHLEAVNESEALSNADAEKLAAANATAVSDGMVKAEGEYSEWALDQGSNWTAGKAEDFVKANASRWVQEAINTSIESMEPEATPVKGVVGGFDKNADLANDSPPPPSTKEAVNTYALVATANSDTVNGPLDQTRMLEAYIHAEDVEDEDDAVDKLVVASADFPAALDLGMREALSNVVQTQRGGTFATPSRGSGGPGDPAHLTTSSDPRATFMRPPLAGASPLSVKHDVRDTPTSLPTLWPSMDIAPGDLSWNVKGRSSGSALILNSNLPFIKDRKSKERQPDLGPPTGGESVRAYSYGLVPNQLDHFPGTAKSPGATSTWLFVPTGLRGSESSPEARARGREFTDEVGSGRLGKFNAFPRAMKISGIVPGKARGLTEYDAQIGDATLALLSAYGGQSPLQQISTLNLIQQKVAMGSRGVPWSAVLDGKIRVSHRVDGRIIGVEEGTVYRERVSTKDVGFFRSREDSYADERYTAASLEIETIIPFKDDSGGPPSFLDGEHRNFGSISEIEAVVTDPDIYDSDTGTFVEGSDGARYFKALGLRNTKAAVSAYFKLQALKTYRFDINASKSVLIKLTQLGVEKK